MCVCVCVDGGVRIRIQIIPNVHSIKSNLVHSKIFRYSEYKSNIV